MDAPQESERVSGIWILRTGTSAEPSRLPAALAGLKREHPRARLTVVWSGGGAPSAGVAGLEWISTGVDQDSDPPGSRPAEVERLARRAAEAAPDLLVTLSGAPGWLDRELASRCPKARLIEVHEGDDELGRLKRELSGMRRRFEELEARQGAHAPDADRWAGQLADAEAEVARLRAEFGAKSAEADLLRERLAEREDSIRNLTNGLATLELHKHYRRLLRERDDMVLMLERACRDREALIGRMALEATTAGAKARRIWLAAGGLWRARVSEPLAARWERLLLASSRHALGEPSQHPGRRLSWGSSMARPRVPAGRLPRIGVVTPTLNQADFLGRALASVTGQMYPKLYYVVQDGGSSDRSPSIIRAEEADLHSWESAPDSGRAAAISRGFAKLSGTLAPDDVMCWVDADDLIAPGALHLVGAYLARHPEVDAVYGHRMIVDDADLEVGRWYLPRHDAESWRWIEWFPRETFFWRKRAWDKAGGLDPGLHHTLARDLLLRIQATGGRVERLPYFLAATRLHAGVRPEAEARRERERRSLRDRLHGAHFDPARMELEMRRAKVRSALCELLAWYGIRW